MAADLAEQLKRWRARVRMTQKEIAQRLGISRERYANWENGKARPPAEFVAGLIQLGFEDPLAVREAPKPYGDASPDTVRLAIETLFSKESDEELRRLARQELYRLLRLENHAVTH